jgi:hypothetical protein
MLNKISWSEFIWFLVSILAPYYLCVIILYFRKEVYAFMRNPVLRRGLASSSADLTEVEPFNSPQIVPTTSSQNDISLSVIHDLLEDLKKLFSVAAKTKMVKEELVQSIHSKLKTYPPLQGSDLQQDITHHIKIEAKDSCGISFDEGDIQRIWRL